MTRGRAEGTAARRDEVQELKTEPAASPDAFSASEGSVAIPIDPVVAADVLAADPLVDEVDLDLAVLPERRTT